MDIVAFAKKHILKIILIPAGGLTGFLYWRYVGCESGTCPIKSVWYWSTLYGIIIAYLLADLIADFIRRRKEKQDRKVADTE